MKNLKPTNRRCICPSCRESFNSVMAFDKHRTGKHSDVRRCLDGAEMIAKGMSEGASGYWVSQAWDGDPEK